MLRRALGFDNADVVLATIAQFLGGLVSLYLWGILIDRIGPYVVFRFGALTSAALYVGLAQLDSPGAATLAAAIAFFFLNAVVERRLRRSRHARALRSRPARGAGADDRGRERDRRQRLRHGARLASVRYSIRCSTHASDPLRVYHGFFWIAAALQSVSFLPLRIFKR